MKKTYVLYVFALLAFFPEVILSQPLNNVDNENLIITHGPYLQNLTQNGVTIIWTTNKSAVPGIYLTGGKINNKFIRNSHDGIIDGGGTFHKVRIDGLEPGTSYSYRVNSVQIMKYQPNKGYYGDTLTLRAKSFTTIPEKSEELNFTVLNDVHEIKEKISSYLKNGNPSQQDFYFFNGDMVNYLQDPNQLFTGFADTAIKYFASVKPFFYIRGNHETRGYKARELKNYFDFKNDLFYFSFDWGPVHFIILDGGEDKSDGHKEYFGLADYDKYRLEELQWLKSEIKSEAFKKAKYKIVMVHIPIIKEERQGYGAKFLADNFGPVLQGTGINLLISGHTHRAAFYEKEKSGFGYPVLVNSNNAFVEVAVDQNGIKATIKDIYGKIVSEYQLK